MPDARFRFEVGEVVLCVDAPVFTDSEGLLRVGGLYVIAERKISPFEDVPLYLLEGQPIWRVEERFVKNCETQRRKLNA